jgi:hypothetical protein
MRAGLRPKVKPSWHGNVEQLGELVAGAAAPRPSADRAVLRSFRRVPKRIVLDIDDIFDRVRCLRKFPSNRANAALTFKGLDKVGAPRQKVHSFNSKSFASTAPNEILDCLGYVQAVRNWLWGS